MGEKVVWFCARNRPKMALNDVLEVQRKASCTNLVHVLIYVYHFLRFWYTFFLKTPLKRFKCVFYHAFCPFFEFNISQKTAYTAIKCRFLESFFQKNSLFVGFFLCRHQVN